MYHVHGRVGSTSQASGVAPPHRPLRNPLGQVMGQTNAVSCKMQLPHMRQPKSALFVTCSKLVNSRMGADSSRLYGLKGA